MLNEAISNTSPLIYLYRIDGLDWLPRLFGTVRVPGAVVREIAEGRRRGYEVPVPEDLSWIRITEPAGTPSEWFVPDMGPGETAAIALSLEYPDDILLLDDLLARRTAIAAGVKVWGTLRILIEAKTAGLISEVKLALNRLEQSGLWMTEDLRQRILKLANET